MGALANGTGLKSSKSSSKSPSGTAPGFDGGSGVGGACTTVGATVAEVCCEFSSAAVGSAGFCWALAAAEKGRLHQLQMSLVSLSSPHHLQNMHRPPPQFVSHKLALFLNRPPALTLTFPKMEIVSSMPIKYTIKEETPD